MRLETYINDNDITYEMFCEGIDEFIQVHEGVLDKITGPVGKIFNAIKTEITKISDEFGVGISHIMLAFKNKDVFHLMKAIGFNIKTLLKSVNSFTTLFHNGLSEVFKEIYKTGLFKQIKAGTVKIDEVMDKYPILKKVSGPIVAGLLFYMWTQMTFIGNMDYDFDFTNIAKALSGSFSLADLFASPQGLMLSTLFMTGGLISAPWLGSTAYNLVLAISYTLMKRKGDNLKVLQKMRGSMRLEKL